MHVTTEMVFLFRDELLCSPRHTWGAQISARAQSWRVDATTVRRRLKREAGLSLGVSKGKQGSYIPDEDVEMVAQVIARTIRKGRPGMDVRRAIEDCWRNGRFQNKGRKPSVSRMRARMREMNIHVAQMLAPSPHIRLKTTYANQMHQVDASLCIQYHFDRSAEQLRFRFVDRNKLDKMKGVATAVHRWLITDHCSGVYLPKYYDSKGENTPDLLDFLYWAWRPKEDSRIPFAGVPDLLYTDPGSVFRGVAITNLCLGLDLEIRHHRAGNARATGAVESAHWNHERNVESKLRLQPVRTIEHLIEVATLEALALNTTDLHSRHGRTRFDAWVDWVKRPLRVPVPDFEQFAWAAHGTEEKRHVRGDGTISWKGGRFQVAEAHVKEVVLVRPHPYELGMIRVFSRERDEYQVTLVKLDDKGFYSTSVEVGTGFAQPASTEVERIAAAAKELEPALHTFRQEHELPVEDYGWAPLPTVEIEAETVPTRKMVIQLDSYEAIDHVVARLGRGLTVDEGQWWAVQLGEGVTQQQLDELFEQFSNLNQAEVKVA